MTDAQIIELIKTLTPQQKRRILEVEFPVGTEMWEDDFVEKWRLDIDGDFECNPGSAITKRTMYTYLLHFRRPLADRMRDLTKGWGRVWHLSQFHGDRAVSICGAFFTQEGTGKVGNGNLEFKEDSYLHNLTHGEPPAPKVTVELTEKDLAALKNALESARLEGDVSAKDYDHLLNTLSQATPSMP